MSFPFSRTKPCLQIIMTIKEFYSTRQWKKCREAYKKSVGYLCEECLRNGKIVPAEDVHHIQKLTPQNVNDPSIALSFSNLMALCNPCHDKMHGRARRYTVDEYGRVTPIE